VQQRTVKKGKLVQDKLSSLPGQRSTYGLHTTYPRTKTPDPGLVEMCAIHRDRFNITN